MIEIAGIAKRSKYTWISEPPLDFVYLPFRQHLRSQMSLLVESYAPDAATLAPVLREVVRSLDPDMPTFDVRTMHDLYTQRGVKTSTIVVQVVAGLGCMGLILAVVGLYGLIAYSVSRRTREIGIRLAIGPDRRKVVWLVLRQGLQLGVYGVAVGMVLSLFACRFATSVFSLVTSGGAAGLIYGALPLLLLGVVAIATWAPAHRASLIDPMRALRDE